MRLTTEEDEEMRGRVKGFDNGKGYGFIEGDDGKEYLVHFTAIQSLSQDLRENDRVEFDPLETPKGPQASGVRRIERSER